MKVQKSNATPSQDELRRQILKRAFDVVWRTELPKRDAVKNQDERTLTEQLNANHA